MSLVLNGAYPRNFPNVEPKSGKRLFFPPPLHFFRRSASDFPAEARLLLPTSCFVSEVFPIFPSFMFCNSICLRVVGLSSVISLAIWCKNKMLVQTNVAGSTSTRYMAEWFVPLWRVFFCSELKIYKLGNFLDNVVMRHLSCLPMVVDDRDNGFSNYIQLWCGSYSNKPPEVYKGKGILYIDEVVNKKQGKKSKWVLIICI